eukprot:4974589-Prymnesium_polylepis.1
MPAATSASSGDERGAPVATVALTVGLQGGAELKIHLSLDGPAGHDAAAAPTPAEDAEMHAAATKVQAVKRGRVARQAGSKARSETGGAAGATPGEAAAAVPMGDAAVCLDVAADGCVSLRVVMADGVPEPAPLGGSVPVEAAPLQDAPQQNVAPAAAADGGTVQVVFEVGDDGAEVSFFIAE